MKNDRHVINQKEQINQRSKLYGRRITELLEKGVNMEGYCLKCKTKKEMKDAEEITMKNGRKAMKGKCLDCGTGMFKILGNK